MFTKSESLEHIKALVANFSNNIDYIKKSGHYKEAHVEDENTICPLCIKKLSAKGFFNKVAQAAGREVSDLTVTELNLFHIKELVIGSFNHTTYNLGWGHHHCNVVTKDVGIIPTLKWMQKIVDINIEKGYLKDTHL